MEVNIKPRWSDSSGELLALIGQPIRLQLLAVMAAQEACVCHFEAVLGLRQSVISQHLMVLRRGGQVQTRRDGRNIYYSIVQANLPAFLEAAVVITGNSVEDLRALGQRPVAGCPCPQCNPGREPYSCQGMHPESS